MQGCVRLHGSVLYVGRHALTAEIASFDLDGRALETRFQFRDGTSERSSVSGLDVDADRRIWVADGAARRVRCFTLFGQEVASVGQGDGGAELRNGGDVRGEIGEPVDLRVMGEDDDTTLLVASAGNRRHALQRLHLLSGKGASIAPLGDPEASFRRIRGIDLHGDLLAVAEAGAQRVQVFHGDPLGRMAFRFAFAVPEAMGTPESVAVLPGDRVLVATSGERSGVILFDAAGRPIRVVAGDGAGGAAAGGHDDALVDQPSSLAVDVGASDRETRVCVLDRDGERVQVLSLDGRSYGSILGFGG